MSGFWLTPAAPGTVAAEHLDKVRELHATVRQWIEASADAQKNDHLRANLPYVDLMFAFGFATLGDPDTANKMVEDARKVMEGPIPTGGTAQADQAVLAAIVRNFLFKACRSRVDQALAGKPHTGPLPPEIRAELDEIRKMGSAGAHNNIHMLAEYTIDAFRQYAHMLEPSERVDRYAAWFRRSQTPNPERPAAPRPELPLCMPAEARIVLADPKCQLPSTEYAALARSCVRALGNGAGGGLDEIAQLLCQLQPARITNRFTTAVYYSRLHIQLIDETVLAVCRFCLENPVPLTVMA